METEQIMAFVYVAIGLLMVLVLTTGACNISQPEAMRILTQDGVTDIKIGGHAFFECAQDDTFSVTFSGIKGGQAISGSICGGWLKGDTIRFK